MNLKNFSAYKLNKNLVIESLGELNKALTATGYREMGPQEREIMGFVQPMEAYRPGAYAVVVGPKDLDWHTDPENYDAEMDEPEAAFQHKEYPLIHGGTDCLVLEFFTQTKVLVADDLKPRVDAQVREVEESQNRKVYKTERQEIRTTIELGILPYAQSRRKSTTIVFQPNGLLLIGATGAAAEKALSHLRTVLGTLPIVPIVHRVDLPPENVLTMVAKAQGEDIGDGVHFDTKGFVITDDYQVQQAGELPEIARCKNTDISQESIQEFIRDGKVVTHASLKWENRVMFKTDTKLIFRAVRLDHGVYDEVGDGDEMDLATAGYSETLIELAELSNMLDSFIALHGGLSIPAAEQDTQELILRGFWENLFEGGW